MVGFLLNTQFAPAYLFGVVPCGIISYVATISCVALFSYLDTIFTTPSDL
jgi:hypothetical protein